MNECVEYRYCDCDMEDCPKEIITVLFQHEDIEQCRNFMLKFADTINTYTEILVYPEDKDRIQIKIHLLNGLIGTRKLRCQKVRK